VTVTAYILLADQLDAQAALAEEQARTLRAQAAACRELNTRPATSKVVDMGPRTLTVADAAARLACSKSQVRRLVHEGELHVVRITKRAFRVTEADVVALIRRRTA
jgi:excisionase family DNA binding protein